MAAVEAQASQGVTGISTGDAAESSTSDGGTNTARIVDGQCGSDLEGHDNTFMASTDVTFYWKIDGSTLKGALKVTKEAWVGFGVSENGMMIDSEGIIGKPAESTTTKYLLADKVVGEIVPAKDTTSLKAASIQQEGGVTTLTFENALDCQ